MIISKKQLGFALPIAILIAVVLIVAGGTGYYFYKEKREGIKYEYTSPEKTFSLFIKAMEEGDIDAYLECWTEESQQSQELLKITRKLLGPEGLKVEAERYKAAELQVTEKTADRAVITLKWETGMGDYVFKKEKGNWKMDFIESWKKARDTIRLSALTVSLRRALEFYYDRHGGYPVLADTSEDGEFLQVLIDEGHLGSVLLDPFHPKYQWYKIGVYVGKENSSKYFYEYEGNENSYTLKCYCEIEGGNCDMEDGIKDHVFIYSYSHEEIPEEKEKEQLPSEEGLSEVEILVKEMAKLEESLKNLQSSFSPEIENLAWRIADNEVTITGHAETREDVLKIKEALEEIPQLTDIECPASTWIKPEDIDFTFTAKFKSGF